MQFALEFSLGDNENFLTQRIVYHNPGKQAYPWMSGSNAAVPSAPDTKFDFPKSRVLRHASAVDTIDWETQGPKTELSFQKITTPLSTLHKQLKAIYNHLLPSCRYLHRCIW